MSTLTPENPLDNLSKLTNREIEVLQHFCNGLPYKKIAAELTVGLATIKSHMGHVYMKLGLTELDPPARKMILYQEVCPALKQIEIKPDTPDQTYALIEVPFEVEQMVDEDERALFALPSGVEQDFAREEPIKTIQIKDPAPLVPINYGRRLPCGWVMILCVMSLLIGAGLIYIFMPRLFPPETEVVYQTGVPFIATFVDEVEVTRVHEITTTPMPTLQPQTVMITTTPLPTSPPEQVEVVVVVTATEAPSPTINPQVVEPGFVFEDDFETGPDPKWEIISGELGMRQGWYTVTEPHPGYQTEHITILSDHIWKNVSVELEMLKLDMFTTVKERSAAGGIIVGYQENGEAIGFIFRSGSLGLEFATLSPERQWSAMKGTYSNVAHFRYGASQIRVEVKRDMTYAYVDDELATYTQVTGYKPGQVGLWFRTNSSQGSLDYYVPRFDYIKVEALPVEK